MLFFRDKLRNMEFVYVFTFILFQNVYVNGWLSCSAHSSSGCGFCVQQPSWCSNCKWCELDGQCHATGSFAPFNPCNANQVVKTVANCSKQDIVGEYNPQYAYDLLKLSTIPYADDINKAVNCLDSHRMVDFEIVEWIDGQCEDTNEECFHVAALMIFKKKKAIVLAYRGTSDLTQLSDEALTTLFTFKEPSDIGIGEVQSYFKEAHDTLYECVKESVKAQISNHQNYEFWITGHSLGGAIALKVLGCHMKE